LGGREREGQDHDTGLGDSPILKQLLNCFSDVGSPWKALADDSRRQMLQLLRDEEMTPSQIRTRFLLTLPAVSTHLRVLKDAGLVVERRQGKYRFYSVNFDTVSEVVAFFDTFWDQRLQKKRSSTRPASRR